VGSGGGRYLKWIEGFEWNFVELRMKGCTLDGVRGVDGDFLEWEPDRQYDLVFCLQVLEHIHDRTPFARKLFDCGRVVIVSVPYRWPAGSCDEHVHDPVDEHKLRDWTGRMSVERDTVDARFVAVY